MHIMNAELKYSLKLVARRRVCDAMGVVSIDVTCVRCLKAVPVFAEFYFSREQGRQT